MNLPLGEGTPPIWFAGDVHGRFSHILKQLELTPKTERPAAIIFLGDLEPQRPLHQEYQPFLDIAVECWHIHGNHDTDRQDTWEYMANAQKRNLHGRVVTIDGIRIAGLGGIFRNEVWYPREGSEVPLFRNYSEYERNLRRAPGVRRRVSKLDEIRAEAVPARVSDLINDTLGGRLRRQQSTIFPETVERLARQQADVLVCHEAPSGHRHGFPVIDGLARAMGVGVVFHGHHHDDREYSNHGDGYRTYSVGLRGVRDLYGGVIRLAEFG